MPHGACTHQIGCTCQVTPRYRSWRFIHSLHWNPWGLGSLVTSSLVMSSMPCTMWMWIPLYSFLATFNCDLPSSFYVGKYAPLPHHLRDLILGVSLCAPLETSRNKVPRWSEIHEFPPIVDPNFSWLCPWTWFLAIWCLSLSPFYHLCPRISTCGTLLGFDILQGW